MAYPMGIIMDLFVAVSYEKLLIYFRLLHINTFLESKLLISLLAVASDFVRVYVVFRRVRPLQIYYKYI